MKTQNIIFITFLLLGIAQIALSKKKSKLTTKDINNEYCCCNYNDDAGTHYMYWVRDVKVTACGDQASNCSGEVRQSPYCKGWNEDFVKYAMDRLRTKQC